MLLIFSKCFSFVSFFINQGALFYPIYIKKCYICVVNFSIAKYQAGKG